MATTSVKEKAEGRAAPRDDNGNTYTRVFIVIQDDVNDGPRAARVAEDPTDFLKVPGRGDEHPDDSLARVVSIVPVETPSRVIWEVVITYDPLSYQSSDIDDPTELDDIVDIKFANSKVIVVKDVGTTSPIENSAREPLIIEDEESAMTITINRNVNLSEFSPSIAKAFTGTMNSTSVTVKGYSVPEFFGKITWTGKQAQAQGFKYWQTVIKVDVAPDSRNFGWKREVLDAGYMYLDATIQKKIFLQDGSQPKSVVKLDGAGAVETNPTLSTYLVFQTKTAVSWGSLNLNRQDTNQ